MRRTTLVAVVLLIVTVVPASADSIISSTFVYQGTTPVPLGPGLNPLLGPTIIEGGSVFLNFLTYFNTVGSFQVQITFDLLGQEQTLGPYTLTCAQIDFCAFGTSFRVPQSYKVVPGTFTLTLNGVNETYDFRYQTVPEPATLALLGTGLIAVWWRKHSTMKRRR